MDGLSTTMPGVATGNADADYRVKANAAAEQFEGFFIGQMLKEMRETTAAFAADGSVYKDPVAADMLGMTDRMVADSLSGQHAFGIADAILRQLLPTPAATTTAKTAEPAPAAKADPSSTSR